MVCRPIPSLEVPEGLLECAQVAVELQFLVEPPDLIGCGDVRGPSLQRLVLSATPFVDLPDRASFGTDVPVLLRDLLVIIRVLKDRLEFLLCRVNPLRTSSVSCT